MKLFLLSTLLLTNVLLLTSKLTASAADSKSGVTSAQIESEISRSGFYLNENLFNQLTVDALKVIVTREITFEQEQDGFFKFSGSTNDENGKLETKVLNVIFLKYILPILPTQKPGTLYKGIMVSTRHSTASSHTPLSRPLYTYSAKNTVIGRKFRVGLILESCVHDRCRNHKHLSPTIENRLTNVLTPIPQKPGAGWVLPEKETMANFLDFWGISIFLEEFDPFIEAVD